MNVVQTVAMIGQFVRFNIIEEDARNSAADSEKPRELGSGASDAGSEPGPLSFLKFYNKFGIISLYD